MAGGAARVRIDGFNGGTLPSRDVIRSIRIVRDTFPAENHSAESDGIDIITQAGVGPIRGGFSTRVRDSVLERRQSVRRRQGAGAHAELRRQPRRRDHAEQELVLAVRRRPQAVRHAGGDLHHDRRPQGVDAARPAAERRLERQRHVRLRADDSSTCCASATRRTSRRAAISASAASISPSAPTRARSRGNQLRDAGDRADRQRTCS